MKLTSRLALCCFISFGLPAQITLKLSLAQAIEMAATSGGNPSIALAGAVLQQAESRQSQAHSLLFPNLEASFTEQNVTRNLGAEGFNFPTGVPNFTIPQGVGPFNTYDVRVLMTQNVFDLSAIRRSHALKASSEAARADVDVQRDRSAAQVAHDYLVGLRAEAAVEAARAGVDLAENLLRVAQDREDAGKAAAVEVTRAKLRLATDRRKLAAAENDRTQARLQLLGDLGLDFNTILELTDRLEYVPEPPPDAAGAVAGAYQTRVDLHANQMRGDAARSLDSAIGLERVPSVTAYGDVGPLSSIITHTVGVSVRIPIFDGGRRAARREETTAQVQQQEIEQRDIRRQIELQVRKAAANLQAAARDIEACDAALALADEALGQARRRFEGGVASNIDVVDAQGQLALSRDDRIAVVYAWNQARVDFAQASGTIRAVSMPRGK